MNKTSKSQQKPNQSFMSTKQNPLPSPKKQFPSISLSKHLQQYKAYRSIDNRKKFPDSDKNNTFNITLQQKSILMMRNGQMPSIHNANEVQLFEANSSTSKIQKIQFKILKNLANTKREDQWKLYMAKSQLIQEKGKQFEEIQEYLLKTLSKIYQKNWNSQNKPFDEQQTQNQCHENSHFQSITDMKNVTKNYTNSVLQAQQELTKKSSQPSLRVLKDQLNTFNNSSRDASYLQTPGSFEGINKTSINFHQAKSLMIQRLEARYEEQINKMTFERSLLEKKLELYSSRVSQLQSRLKQQNILIEPSDLNHLQSTQLSQVVNKSSANKKPVNSDEAMLKNLINQNKYKSQAQFKKIQNQTLTRQLNIIKQFSFKLKSQNQKLNQTIEDLEKQCIDCREFKKYKQLWLMQSQQMIGWKDMWKTKKDQNTKLVNKIKILKEKNKQLLHSFNFSMVVNPDQEEDKQQLQNIIKCFQDWLKVISVPRVNCISVDPKSLLQSNSIKENQYMPDPENVNYKLLKPNFFIFFQAYQKTIMMEKNILNTRPLEPTFFVKIRAILDSLYNHFNSFGSHKFWVSFPQFVIGFLQKYEINFTTLKMQSRKKPMSSEQKLTFLMNLFNKKLSNTWQCQLFRSFILQEYTLDQIYFYLDCRNDLNGGSTLTHGLGTMDPVSYVKLHKALSTTQRKLVPYENHIIQRVKSIIKSRKKQKNGEVFIDRHFVLKLLLQVYALQKSKSQRVFQASFKSKNSKKTTISYSDFFGFMNKNFEFLSTVDICQLYRQIYALSSGKITFKSVHYMCSSKGLFIPLIWTKRLNMNVLDKSLNNDMMLLDLQNSARKIGTHLNQVGVEQISKLENDLNYFLRQLDWYRNNRQVFYFKLQEIKIKILKSNCLLEWQSSTYTPNQLLSTEQIREGILQIHNLIHQSEEHCKFLSLKREQKDKAIKQLTRNFKIRIQQSMRQFKRVDQEQLKKLKQQVALEIKMRQIRQRGDQAQAAIESLKMKQKSIIGNGLISANYMINKQKQDANSSKNKKSKQNLQKERRNSRDRNNVEKNNKEGNKVKFEQQEGYYRERKSSIAVIIQKQGEQVNDES